MCGNKARIPRDDAVVLYDRLVIPPHHVIHPAQIGLNDQGLCIKPARLSEMRQGLIVASHRDPVRNAIPVVRQGILGIELEGTLELSTCSRPVPFVERVDRSEEHTSELQSPCNLVCRLLLEK